jgi:queuine tRNA-ribosyltransferase
MRWDKPLLTDSGGYQVMSLAQLRKLDADGVTFRSHVDGAMHRLTPESAMEIQADQIGADIVMQLDECPALPAPRADVEKAMRLSLDWALRCKHAFGKRDSQDLFAIVQGGVDPDLREESARTLVGEGFDGYAVGGLAVGEGHEAMLATLEATVPQLPDDRPRYLMGVGKPLDIVESVWRGIDMFDCVLPTRSGRHGQAWTDAGPINITNARFAEDLAPLDESIDCPASRAYSKAYLHHLFKAGELLGQTLLSWHNVAYYQSLMQRLRAAISEGRLGAFRDDFKEIARTQHRGSSDPHCIP